VSALGDLPFQAIWLVDTEFIIRGGERPDPVCLCAREVRSGRTLRLWRDQIIGVPYDTGPNALFVGFVTQAEFGILLALGLPLPKCVLDLYVEFRRLLNGWNIPVRRSLMGALAFFELQNIGAAEKEAMRDRIKQGWPFSEAERTAILDYCESDVQALETSTSTRRCSAVASAPSRPAWNTAACRSMVR
jgi:hypothetical protein